MRLAEGQIPEVGKAPKRWTFVKSALEGVENAMKTTVKASEMIPET